MQSVTQKTILIVDDSQDLVDLIQEELLDKLYQVQTASNGEEALDLIAKQGLPDLILLDMKMPVMDGWTFSEKLTDQYGRTCPIVIMTGEDYSRTRAMEIGADSYLGKPFDLQTLNKVVESMLAE